MPFAIITTTNARRDIQQAIDWENIRSHNLGARFLADLNLKFTSLSITPLMGVYDITMSGAQLLMFLNIYSIILLMIIYRK